MSSSSNITLRPRFRACVRMSDDQIVLVNLDFVRAVEPIVGGLKLSFGNAASDSINIKAVTLEQLTEQMTP